MRSRFEIIWHGFLYSIYDSHVEILESWEISLVKDGLGWGLTFGKIVWISQRNRVTDNGRHVCDFDCFMKTRYQMTQSSCERDTKSRSHPSMKRWCKFSHVNTPYKVKPEAGGGRHSAIHYNLLLPCNDFPFEVKPNNAHRKSKWKLQIVKPHMGSTLASNTKSSSGKEPGRMLIFTPVESKISPSSSTCTAEESSAN